VCRRSKVGAVHTTTMGRRYHYSAVTATNCRQERRQSSLIFAAASVASIVSLQLDVLCCTRLLLATPLLHDLSAITNRRRRGRLGGMIGCVS